MIRRPPRSTRTDTLFPYTTLFRSVLEQFGDIGRLRVAVVDDDAVIGADAEVDRLVRVEFGRLQSLAQQPGKFCRVLAGCGGQPVEIYRTGGAVECLSEPGLCPPAWSRAPMGRCSDR